MDNFYKINAKDGVSYKRARPTHLFFYNEQGISTMLFEEFTALTKAEEGNYHFRKGQL